MARLALLATSDLSSYCVLDITGEAMIVASASLDDTAKARALETHVLDRDAPHLGSSAIQTGTPLLIPEVSEAFLESISADSRYGALVRALQPKSVLAVPLVRGDVPIGVMTLISSKPGVPYDNDDVALAQDIAARTVLALENAHLFHAARQATMDRERVLQIVSHDLSNPLNAIVISSDSLLFDEPNDRRGRKIETVRRSAERMRRLIKDLVDHAALAEGRFRLQVTPCRTEELLDDAVESQRLLGGAKAQVLEIETSVEAVVTCDRDRIQQVFANLIGNAMKFTPPGGTIRLRCDLADGLARFAVSDTGPGIATDELPHVFDRFWQAAPTAHLGTGLGLAIAKGIVQQHGGDVGIASEIGAGTTVWFTLPLG